MKVSNWLSKAQKGQSFAELGAFMVVLLLILVGVIEFGMLIFQYIAMKDAAQEGSVYATMYPSSCNQTIERVKEGLNSTDLSGVQIDVLVNGLQCNLASAGDACANREIKVTVRQPDYKIMVPFLGTVLGRQTISVSAVATGTIIRPPCP